MRNILGNTLVTSKEALSMLVCIQGGYSDFFGGKDARLENLTTKFATHIETKFVCLTN